MDAVECWESGRRGKRLSSEEKWLTGKINNLAPDTFRAPAMGTINAVGTELAERGLARAEIPLVGVGILGWKACCSRSNTLIR